MAERPGMTAAQESVLIRLGAAAATRLDPRLSRAAARTIRAGVDELLVEIASDPTYRTLRSVAGAVFSHRRTPHAFAYRPFPPRTGPSPVLVALHGHGGNFAVWIHSWRAFADRFGFVVIAPTWGHGNWEHPASPRAIEHALREYRRHFGAYDAGRVFLAGISQGGAGVGRAARAFPNEYSGFVFLSPTTEPRVLASPAAQGKRMLFVWGGADRNVTPHSVEAGILAAKSAGAVVEEMYFPAADHFLYFAERAAVHNRIAAWAAG